MSGSQQPGQPYLLGVDTGGTYSRTIVLDAELELLGTGISGPGNFRVAGVDGARTNVEESIAEALTEAGIDDTARLVGGFGMGSLDTDADYAVIEGFLDEIPIVDEKYIENDVVISHYAMTAGEPGVTVVAGTGAMGYGHNEAGEHHRTSGWGWLIGDEGSGFDAARRGLEAATKAYDGRGEPTELVEAAREHFEIDAFEELFTAVYDDLEHPKRISSFAKPVAEAAGEGDAVASRIVEEAAEELVSAAVAIVDELAIEPPVGVGCVGSFGTSAVVFPAFETKLRAAISDVSLLEPVDNPAIGGIVMVCEELDIPFGHEDVSRLDREITARRADAE